MTSTSKYRALTIVSLLFALFCFSWCSGLLFAQQPEQPVTTIKVDVNLVLVNVTVQKPDGAAVTNLGREDFQLFEDGKRQPIEIFHAVDVPFHLVLVIDASGSTKGKLTVLKAAALRFIELIQPADQLAIIEVKDHPSLLESFSSDRKKLSNAVKQISTSVVEGTALYDSIALALMMLQKVSGRKAMVVLSDGLDSEGSHGVGHLSFEKLERAVMASHVSIYSIAINNLEEQRNEFQEFIARSHQPNQLALWADLRGSDSPEREAVAAAMKAFVSELKSADSVMVVNVDQRGVWASAPQPVPVNKAEVFLDQLARGDFRSWISLRGKTFLSGSGNNVFVFKPWSESSGSGTRGQPGFDLPIFASHNLREVKRFMVPVPFDENALTAVKDFVRVNIDPSLREAEEFLTNLDPIFRADQERMKKLSDETGGEIFYVNDLADLTPVYERIAAQLRTVYTLGYYASHDPERFSTHRVEVRTREPTYRV